MTKIKNLKEIQKIEYDILCVVVDFFKKNHISYFLAGGTMLGAVRHGGFIPWDDDIDILVPRKDYEKLKKLISKNTHLDHHIVFQMPGMEGYPYPFIKAVDIHTRTNDYYVSSKFVLPIWIDIFPLDHFPDDDMKHKIEILKNKLLRTCLESGIKQQGFKKRLLLKVLFLAMYYLLGGYRNITILMDKSARRMNERYMNSEHYGNGTWPEKMKDYFKEEAVFPYIKMKFEMDEFNVPKNYDLYLSQFYGDYMKLPPEDERPQHMLAAYYIEGYEK